MVGRNAGAVVASPHNDDPPIHGRLLGVDGTGALRLATPAGVRLLSAGEVTFETERGSG